MIPFLINVYTEYIALKNAEKFMEDDDDWWCIDEKVWKKAISCHNNLDL